MDNVKTIKTMVWELGVFSISGITLFRNYDKQRRDKEFELLKDLSRGFYRTNDISQDSIRIPVFNLDNEKVFTIQIKNTENYYEVSLLFACEEDEVGYFKKYRSYIKYVQTLTEVEVTVSRFLWNMSKFLGDSDLYFRDVTREENEKLRDEVAPAYYAFERGDLEK